MGKNERTITAAIVEVTFMMTDLGTFGPGSLYEQAQKAAASRLGEVVGGDVDPSHIIVKSISTANTSTGEMEILKL